MIGIDGATVARPDGHPESLASPLPEASADFESEFFVEWQVVDDDVSGSTTSGEANSL